VAGNAVTIEQRLAGIRGACAGLPE